MTVRSVGIFVDGDNLSSSHAPRLINIGRSFGALVLAKVYGNESSLKNWTVAVDFQFIYAGCGKNASDLLLAVDAVEFVLTHRPDVVLICSSDSDFSHLARRLREYGKRVVGVGEPKATDNFRKSCSEFKVLKSDPVQKVLPEEQSTPADFDVKIKAVISANSTNGKGMRLADLARIMHAQHSIRISLCPERNWRGYLTKRTSRFALDPRGPDAKVRFIPAGFQAVDGG